MGATKKEFDIYKIGFGAFYGIGLGFFIGHSVSYLFNFVLFPLKLSVIGGLIYGIIFVGFKGKVQGNKLAIIATVLGAVVITLVFLAVFILYEQSRPPGYYPDYLSVLPQTEGPVLAIILGPVIGASLGARLSRTLSIHLERLSSKRSRPGEL